MAGVLTAALLLALLVVAPFINAEGKEVLPAFAYLNRTMSPVLHLYSVDAHQRHPLEQQRLQLLASIQHLEQRRDYLDSLQPGALTSPPGPRPTKPPLSAVSAAKESSMLSARIGPLRSLLRARFSDPYTFIPPTSHLEFENITGLSSEDMELIGSHSPTTRPLLSLGIISDVQYADREEVKRRHFKLSLPKLQHAVHEISNNWSHVDVVLNLGDLVDADIDTNLPVVTPVLQQLRQPTLHVLARRR